MKEINMNYRKEMNALMEPTSFMVFDAVGNVSYEIDQLVKEPLKGLYYGAGMTPVLIDGQEYLPATNNSEEPVCPIDGSCWSVNDVRKWLKIGLKTKRQGRSVFVSDQKYSYDAFRRKPLANVNTVRFMLLWVNNYLASLSPYAARGNYQSKMLDLLIDERARDMLLSGEIDRMLEPLSCEIAAWVGRDIWHMYFVKTRHTTVTIEKTSDYRIWCYYEMLQKAEEQDDE